MPGPWEKYQTPESVGPWEKYADKPPQGGFPEVQAAVGRGVTGVVKAAADWFIPYPPAGDWPELGPKFRGQVSTLAGGIAGIPGQVRESLARTGAELVGGNLPGAGFELAGAVPLLGPPAQQIGQEVAAGQYAPAIGHGLALVAPFAVGGKRLIPTLPQRPVTATGIPLSFGEVRPESWWRGTLEKFVENRPAGRKAFAEFRKGQAEKAVGATGRTGELIAPPTTAREAGEAFGYIMRDSIQAERTAAEAQTAAENARNAAGARRATVVSGMERGGINRYVEDIEAQRSGAHASALGEIRSVADSLGMPATPERAGISAQEAVRGAANAFRDKARTEFTARNQALGTAIVPTGEIKAWAQQLRKRLAGVPGTLAELKGIEVEKLDNALSRLLREEKTGTILLDASGKEIVGTRPILPDAVVFSEAAEIASGLKSISRKYGDLVNSSYVGGVRALVGKFESQIQKAAEQAGALDEYKRLQKWYGENARLFNESSVADLMDMNPEKVAASLWKPNNITPIRELKQALVGNEGQWNQLRRQGIEDLFARSRKPDGSLSPAKLQSNWSSLGADVQAELVGGQSKSLADAIDRARAFEAPVKPERLPEGIVAKPAEVEPQYRKLTPQESSLWATVAKNPEALAQRIFLKQGNETLAQTVRSALRDTPDMWDSLRRAAWDDLQKASTTRRAGGPRVFDSRKFADKWDSLPETGRRLLAGDQVVEIESLVSDLKRVDTAKASTLGTPAYGLIEPTAGAVSLLGSSPARLLRMAEILAAPRVISQMMINPTYGRQWMSSMASGLGTAGRVGSFTVPLKRLGEPYTPLP